MPTVPLTFNTPSPEGGASMALVDSSTRQSYHALSATVDGAWYFRGQVPDDYGSAGAIVVVCLANATTGVHRIGVDLAAISDGEDQDPTLTALTVQAITVPGTAYQQDRITFSSGLPTLAAGDRIIGRVTRDGDGSGGTDSLAVPTLLDTVLLSYTAA